MIEPVDPVQTKSLSAAIEAAMATTPARKPEPRLPPTVSSATAEAPEPHEPDPPPSPAPPLGAWTPPPEPRPQPPARVPPPVARAPTTPFPARPLQPNEGPRRPPLPPARQAVFAQPLPSLPNRPARAPWPEPAERGPAARPPLANGSYGESPPPHHAPDPAARRGSPSGEKGLLIEAVPRRMRLGAPTIAEVRIARDKVGGLLLALNGRDPQASADPPSAQALSVRLRAAKGGFWIEPATPETQWLDSSPGRAVDDYVAWRWTVIPRLRGRSRLTLMVSVHTAGRDGSAATTSPPERVIEVRVGANHLRRALRMTGWIAAGLIGAALARFGPEYWPLASAVLRKTLGL